MISAALKTVLEADNNLEFITYTLDKRILNLFLYYKNYTFFDEC